MAGNGRKWQKIDFRGYLVGNGFPRIIRRGHRGDQEDEMAENGRKWQEMGCRGKMTENGFPRIIRHSPTTSVGLLFHMCLFHFDQKNNKIESSSKVNRCVDFDNQITLLFTFYRFLCLYYIIDFDIEI